MVFVQKTIVVGEPVGRSLRKRYREAALPSWEETGKQFHVQMRPNRFTHRHATEAGYKKRDPKYNRQKFKKYGHTYPLVKTGEVRSLVKTARIKARSGTGQANNQGGVKVTYRGARKLNFKNPHSDINMVEEFTTITEREALLLGIAWQARFQPRMQG